MVPASIFSLRYIGNNSSACVYMIVAFGFLRMDRLTIELAPLYNLTNLSFK